MRLAAILPALLLLAPIAATPAIGSNHEDMLPDRDYVLVMRGASFNGFTHPDTPLLEAFLGETVRFTVVVPPLVGEPHTFHLHGHPWLVDDGRIIDTILLRAGQTHQFSVVAGSVGQHAGDWMYHCHLDEHAALGMWGIFRVYPFATRVAPAEDGALRVSLDRLGVPLDADAIALSLDGAPVAAHVARAATGEYELHAALPADAAGELVVTATVDGLGESVARLALGGASLAPPAVQVPGGHGGALHVH